MCLFHSTVGCTRITRTHLHDFGINFRFDYTYTYTYTLHRFGNYNYKSVIGAVWDYTCTPEITLTLFNCFSNEFPKNTLTLTPLLVNFWIKSGPGATKGIDIQISSKNFTQHTRAGMATPTFEGSRWPWGGWLNTSALCLEGRSLRTRADKCIVLGTEKYLPPPPREQKKKIFRGKLWLHPPLR